MSSDTILSFKSSMTSFLYGYKWGSLSYLQETEDTAEINTSLTPSEQSCSIQ